VEDEDVISAEVLFFQKGEKAYASLSLSLIRAI
jgi:hypothetical protein